MNKSKNTSTAATRLLMGAAAIFFVLIPVVYLYRTFLDPHRLILVKKERDVTIKKDHMSLLLAPGVRLKRGYTLITGVKSACTFRYAQKSTITLHENSTMNIAEFSKSLIILDQAAGKMHIKEYQNKGTAIHVRTSCACIYAIGTDYSVKHDTVNMETTVTVTEGIVHIETIPRGEEIFIKAGEEAIIRRDASPVKREIGSGEEKEWYSYPVYTDPPFASAVTGFDRKGEIIVAGTRYSVICFRESPSGGNILWEYTPENGYFSSKPAIYDNNVYIAAVNRIPGFDLMTGEEKSGFELRDTLRSGYNIVHYQDRLYFVFASGIYTYNKESGSISTDPVIPVIDATLPAFYAGNIYSASYITDYLITYDFSGKKIWSVQLNDKAACSPVIADTSLFSGTKNGTLYNISLDGTVIKQRQLDEDIVSMIYINNRILYLMSGGDKLYEINPQTLDSIKVYYNVTAWNTCGNNVIIGTTDGAVKIVDVKRKTEKEITLPYSKASAFIGYENIFYAGLENGQIIKLEKK